MSQQNTKTPGSTLSTTNFVLLTLECGDTEVTVAALAVDVSADASATDAK